MMRGHRDFTLAPIAMFAYNRPEHLRRALDSLSRNSYARESTLFVFCDGPQGDADSKMRASITEVRRIVRSVKWCGEVEVRQSPRNQGLAASIIGGVTEIVERFGRVIVLEDDLVVSPGFLEFMNIALDLYADSSRVMQISGYMVPCLAPLPRTGFFRQTGSWGWATWADAWSHFSDDAAALYEAVLAKGAERFRVDPCSDRLDALRANVEGSLRTWAVRWDASCYIRGGLTLYPRRTLVTHTGFDGTGTNCGLEGKLSVYGSGRRLKRLIPLRRTVKEDAMYVYCFRRFYRKRYAYWTRSRLRDRIGARIRRLGMGALRKDST